MMVQLLLLFVFCLVGSLAEDADLVLLKDAAEQGSVCLDGSPPGYYMRPGQNAGADKWIVFMEGGGWCQTAELCAERSKTRLGSSTSWPSTSSYAGFLSDDQDTNPDFYDWNMVYAKYCDGGSFAGNVEEPVFYNETKLFFRGRRILDSILASLMEKGLDKASDVILSGSSAGGLSAYLHADYVGSLLGKEVKYRAFPDAGYFLDLPSFNGERIFREGTQELLKLQNCTGGLNQKCVSSFETDEHWKCLIPPYFFQYIQTRTFVINSLYDTAQLKGLELDCLPPNCNETQMEFFENFGKEMRKALGVVNGTNTSGIFADSCLQHVQTKINKTWTEIKVDGLTAAQAFANWYFEKTPNEYKHFDCDFPCNPTCPVKATDPDPSNTLF